MKTTALPGSGASTSARFHIIVSWVLLIAGIARSIALGGAAHRQVEQEARLQFDDSVRDTLYRVRTEIGSYEEVLVGLGAFMGSKERVTRAEFRRYVDGLGLGRRFPGFENL